MEESKNWLWDLTQKIIAGQLHVEKSSINDLINVDTDLRADLCCREVDLMAMVTTFEKEIFEIYCKNNGIPVRPRKIETTYGELILASDLCFAFGQMLLENGIEEVSLEFFFIKKFE
jgi:hypothetical protein